MTDPLSVSMFCCAEIGFLLFISLCTTAGQRWDSEEVAGASRDGDGGREYTVVNPNPTVRKRNKRLSSRTSKPFAEMLRLHCLSWLN